MMNKFFINTLQALAFHVLKCPLNKHNSLGDYTTINLWIDNFTNQFNKRLTTNGPTWTLKRYKSIYNWLKAHLLGVQDHQSLLDPFIKTTSHGIPSELSAIKHLLYSRSPWIRVIMTCLRLFESIKLPVDFDSTSITNGYSGKTLTPISDDFKQFLKKWFNKKFSKQVKSILNINNQVCKENSFRFKSGPMGPSIITSHLCAYALHANVEFHQNFREYCQLTNSHEIMRQFYKAVDMCTLNGGTNNKMLITGKISLASEPAGKTRLFAICNFWLQSVLKPFHDNLMETLKLFRSDGTFNQIEQFNRILEKSKNKRTYCFDLSKATDRFPIVLQEILLEVIVGVTFAKVWKRLISNFPFYYNSKEYKWSVGQPLGAFSSWAMFALTHHMIVQYCWFKVSNKIQFFNQYGLLGDDIVIWHTKVAEVYQQLLSDIGVDINVQKSYINLVNSGEFAKRHFVDGQNISGFGFQMIKQANASLVGWIRFLEILESESFRPPGAVLLLPGNQDKELSKSKISQLHWLWTLRNCFAQNWFISWGDSTISNLNLQEHYVQERIKLLIKQSNSSLRQGDILKLKQKIINLSKRWGIAVNTDCLDISISIPGNLIYHPVVRYIQFRNKIVFDKILKLRIGVQLGLYDQESILKFSSYSDEEYIPSFSLDAFFIQDLNEIKNRLHISVRSKAFKSLIKTNKHKETEGVNFHLFYVM